jgi:hypothetical protein
MTNIRVLLGLRGTGATRLGEFQLELVSKSASWASTSGAPWCKTTETRAATGRGQATSSLQPQLQPGPRR